MQRYYLVEQQRDPRYLLLDLAEKSEIYNRFISPDINDDLYQDLTDLLHVGAAPSYTLLLYLFSKYHNDSVILRDVVKLLVKYFVRRNLTDFPATRDLDRIFIGLIDECEKQNEIDANFIVKYLTRPERFADMETFKKKLVGDIYTDNASMARFILCKIEETHMTKENQRDLWKKDKSNKYIWTIEHIFPEGDNIPEEWIKMIAYGDKEKAKKLQEMCVHKLGNLTITAYNQRLSNFSFIKKRDRRDENGNYIGYKNGLYLNRNLAQKNKWSVEDIEKRTKDLVREALELFKVEEEDIGEIEVNCLDK